MSLVGRGIEEVQPSEPSTVSFPTIWPPCRQGERGREEEGIRGGVLKDGGKNRGRGVGGRGMDGWILDEDEECYSNR